MPYAAPPTAPKRKSRRGLWITLGVIAALLIVVCGGGALAAVQFFAPAVTDGLYCGYLKTQNYTASYSLLSQKMQAQLTSDQYVQASQALDKLEGPVTSCSQATGVSNAYNYTLFGSTATVAVAITRATAGTLEGQLHLKNESGWKVDGIDTSLLGVNLSALQTAAAFCADLQAQNYGAAYALLGGTSRSQLTQTVFTSTLQLNDQIDGTVSSCNLVSLGTGNTDASASLTVSLTRTKLGQKQGTVSLDVEGGTWKVSDVASGLQGTDISAYLVVTQFCADLASANYNDAFSLISDSFKAGSTEADFANAFSGKVDGFKWSGCKPDPTTYKVNGTSATVDVAVTITQLSSGNTGTGIVTFTLVQSGSAWKISNLQNKS